MALPIKDTPTLRGEDAKRFMNDINNPKLKKIPYKELKRMKKNFELIKSWCKEDII